MNNKKLIASLGILILLISLAMIGCDKSKVSKEAGIKIGAILPLSGDAALYGNNDREGIDLAVELVNSKGGINGNKIEILYEDSKADAKTGVSAVNKLANSNISAFIDNAISTVTLAVLPIATEKKIVVLSTGATNPSLSGASPYFYRIWNSDAEEGVFAAKACKEKLSLKKISVVYINNDYGKGLKEVFTKEYANLGGQIVSEETYEKGDKNFKSVLSKIKQGNPEAIYLVGYASETGIIAKQIKELQISAKIVGTVAMEDPVFLKLAGKASEGVAYVFPKSAEGQVVNEFKEQFKKKYGKDPGLLCDAGYDAANLIIEAYRKGAKSSDDIRKVFTELKGFSGASGEITFDAKGDVHKPMVLKVVKDGAFSAN
jgi:branched-chain amino acid transport system substrate-binding protein